MPNDQKQRKIHEFFKEHFNNFTLFTKEDVCSVTGWSKSAFNTYWPKQFKNILEKVENNHYRVTERFRQFLSWEKFKNLVTQVKRSPKYFPTIFKEIVQYEFYLPLTHEGALRMTLDSLFYKDVISPRLKRRIGIDKLKLFFEYPSAGGDEAYIETICKFIETKFGGYSIYHVTGRFRADNLLTQEEHYVKVKTGSKYLIDETTAVTRFVFPCIDKEEAKKVQFLFKELFMQQIAELVSGEDEIWLVETGSENEVSIWKPQR